MFTGSCPLAHWIDLRKSSKKAPAGTTDTGAGGTTGAGLESWSPRATRGLARMMAVPRPASSPVNGSTHDRTNRVSKTRTRSHLNLSACCPISYYSWRDQDCQERRLLSRYGKTAPPEETSGAGRRACHGRSWRASPAPPGSMKYSLPSCRPSRNTRCPSQCSRKVLCRLRDSLRPRSEAPTRLGGPCITYRCTTARIASSRVRTGIPLGREKNTGAPLVRVTSRISQLRRPVPV